MDKVIRQYLLASLNHILYNAVIFTIFKILIFTVFLIQTQLRTKVILDYLDLIFNVNNPCTYSVSFILFKKD